MATYAEKLKDPRWQKLRLQIFERDNWTCQNCYSTEKTLHVHHLDYLPNKQPWEYSNEYLQTLCYECHEEITNFSRFIEGAILKHFRLKLQNTFIKNCAAHVISNHPDLHRLFYLLWQYFDQTDKIMSFLESIHSEETEKAMQYGNKG